MWKKRFQVFMNLCKVFLASITLLVMKTLQAILLWLLVLPTGVRAGYQLTSLLITPIPRPTRGIAKKSIRSSFPSAEIMPM